MTKLVEKTFEVRSTITHRVPEGATHYVGCLTLTPEWWKYVENSTGTVKQWAWYDHVRNGWYLQGEHKPSWIREIPPEIKENSNEPEQT